jgi:hypothetical protein
MEGYLFKKEREREREREREIKMEGYLSRSFWFSHKHRKYKQQSRIRGLIRNLKHPQICYYKFNDPRRGPKM